VSAAVTVTNWFGAVFFHLVIPVVIATAITVERWLDRRGR
jgi:hypothetical protein